MFGFLIVEDATAFQECYKNIMSEPPDPLYPPF
jgi:hypothetical protein